MFRHALIISMAKSKTQYLSMESQNYNNRSFGKEFDRGISIHIATSINAHDKTANKCDGKMFKRLLQNKSDCQTTMSFENFG